MFGVIEKSKIILRSGATPNDIVAVTGPFGITSVGLKIILENIKKIDNKDYFMNSVFTPKARLKEGITLPKTKAVTSSIDSSDGLAWSLHEIAKASKVGFIINNLPIDKKVEDFAKTNHYDLRELILYGGEEYELVLTIKPKLWKKAKNAISEVGGELIPIGRVTAKKNLILEHNGEKHTIKPKGYEHFKNN
jgi:thiamine-monophosphate kinase